MDQVRTDLNCKLVVTTIRNNTSGNSCCGLGGAGILFGVFHLVLVSSPIGPVGIWMESTLYLGGTK